MNINETKDILIKAHEQLSSFEKSIESLGAKDQYFDLEFEWIHICIGLCEIYKNTSDSFVKARALEKINFLLGAQANASQLSFNFNPATKPSASRNTQPTKDETSSLRFESASFSDD